MPRSVRITLCLLICVALAGCASERAKAADRKARQDQKDYVEYTPVGSNIPVKIPKDSVLVTESETDRTQEVMRTVQRQGVLLQSDPAAGANAIVPPQPTSR
jgi:hypothetical protein